MEPGTTDLPATQAMLKSALKEVMTVRKLALIGAAAALWLFVAALPVFADGGPHMKATNNGTAGLSADSCAGCHRAHTATAEDLLNSEQPELCLNCHDGSKATTDVVDGVQYSANNKTTPVLGALRGGGFSYALIDSSNAARVTYLSSGALRNIGHVQPLPTGQKVTSTHSMVATGAVWGNGAASGTASYGVSVQMECSSCHNPHGNGLYRILQTLPGEDFAALSPGFDQSDNAGVEVQDTTYAGLRNYTIKPTTGGTGLAANIITADTGDYWRYHYDPTGVKSWALTSSGPAADPMNTGWNSLTASYASSSGTKYVVKYPVNAAGIAAYNTQLATYGINDPVTSAASISVLDNKGGLMTAWCVQCHTRYNGNQAVTGASGSQSLGASSLFNNSGGDAVFMFKHGTARIGCEQCHVSHGSNALMIADPSSGSTNSLNYTNPDGTTPATVSGAGTGSTVSGDSRLLKVDNRGTCQLCHDPTGTAAAGTYVGPTATPGN